MPAYLETFNFEDTKCLGIFKQILVHTQKSKTEWYNFNTIRSIQKKIGKLELNIFLQMGVKTT